MNLDAVGPTTGPTTDLAYNTDDLKYLPLEVPIATGTGRDVTFFKRNTSTFVDMRIRSVPSERIMVFP